MGIGGDIKPKKVYRYKTSHHDPFGQENEIEKSHYEEVEKSEHDPGKIEEIEDDFFHDYNKDKPKKPKKEEGSDGFLFQKLNAKNITWLLVIALAVIVVYQNFDSIKGLVTKTDNPSKNTNTNDQYYEGVTTNKNSNSTSTNVNANTNTNANLNTNSAAATTTDKSGITLQVLNGNGVAGSADTVTATLTATGFTPAKSGNARKFTYPESIIYYRTGEEASANLVKAALPTLTTTLTNSDSIVGKYDVIVVVGKK